LSTSDDIQGIDREPVTEWLTAHIGKIEPPLDFHLIAGGHSNLTFRVTDQASGRWVLRRPPLGQVLATAHDMGREHRIISALGPTDVPVPPTIGLCTDESVNGAPFYVMDFVPGQVIRDSAAAEALSEPQRTRASESIVDVMAAIHAVDLETVGLDDLGRHEGYIARQLKRWYSQYQGSKEHSDVDFPLVDRVHDALIEQIPRQQGTAIVHGDYRLDNCMLADDGSVAAVLDWEICTLGDPLADAGLLWVYWADNDSPSPIPQASPTTMPGFLSKAELLDRYQAASGLDLSSIDFYIAFGFWKLTCIIAGVYSRYAAGAMGDSTSDSQIEGFRMMIDALAQQADDATTRLASGA